MCARIIQTTDVRLLGRIYDIETDNAIERAPTWNGGPRGLYNLVRTSTDGPLEIAGMRWGLVPSGNRDASFAPVNARSESAHWKPTFREAFRLRRCVFPVEGWYEWRRDGARRVPYLVERNGGDVLHLAGIWERWRNGDGVAGFAVLTTEPVPAVAAVHDRQPSVLSSLDEVREWLSPDTEARRLQELARRTGDGYIVREVSAAVNSTRNDGPELISAA